ncbi:MAG TPA: hypothetical protein VFY64_06775 [Nitrososphaeraceae archaeon]|nr:hypothetical protein [Nitrososphaeraceae archaeon]
MNINRKIILAIAFLSAVTPLASIDSSDAAVEESFRVLNTVTGVQ